MGRINSSSKKIAIVEDQDFYADYLADVIDGYIKNQVKTYYDFEKFYTYFSSNHDQFELVILDRFIQKYDLVNENIVNEVRALGYKGKIILLTSASKHCPAANRQDFDLILKKSGGIPWYKILFAMDLNPSIK